MYAPSACANVPISINIELIFESKLDLPMICLAIFEISFSVAIFFLMAREHSGEEQAILVLGIIPLKKASFKPLFYWAK